MSSPETRDPATTRPPAPTTFSVIIPLYNAERSIGACLASILDQSYPHFEIVVVDDASTDGSRECVERCRDARIRLLNNASNAGPSHCRNAALHVAAGDYIVFVDADDWLDPDYLASIAEAIGGRASVDYVVTRYRIVTTAGTIGDNQAPDLAAPLDSFLLDRIVSSVWAKAFRADLIRRNAIRFPDIRYMEDSAFNAQFLLLATAAVAAPSAVYHYSKLGASATTRTFNDDAVAAIEGGLGATEAVLARGGYANPDLIAARAMRMLLLHGIFRLAADHRSGRGAAFAPTFQKRMAARFPVAAVLQQPFLRAQDKLLITAFYAVPAATVRALAQIRR